VNQKAQTASACQYYVLNYLRHRIGKIPCEELKSARAIEKLCSLRRKEISAIDGPVGKILEDILGIKRFTHITTRGEEEQARKLFEECLRWEPDTVENLLKRLLERLFTHRIEIDTKFLNDLDVDIKKMFESDITLENGYLIDWSDFETADARSKGTMLSYFAYNVMAEKYGLKKSTWSPGEKIDSLIEELKKNGPLAIGGVLGKAAYAEEPFKLNQKMGDRDIYGWRPGSKRIPLPQTTGHAYLLVGAKKIKEQGYVYFIDPSDPSDPNDKSKQTIYVCSYRNFLDHLIDLHGRPCSQALICNGNQQLVPPYSKAGYAYYGNAQVRHDKIEK